jgi:predicted nucleic acid-binding protein
MILSPNNDYAALLDACVLVPMPLCDTLLRLATEPSLYRPLWSESILLEVGAALEKMEYTKLQSDRRLRIMRDHFPEASVNPPANIAPSLTCIPDADDRHVLAAAICARANVIVTFNEKHFPEDCLEPYGIMRQNPDDFLIDQFHLDRALMAEKLDSQAIAIRQSRQEIIVRLRNLAQAPKFAAVLEEYL